MLFNLQIQLINFHTIVTLVGFSYMWLSTFIHIIYIMVIVYLNVKLFIDA